MMMIERHSCWFWWRCLWECFKWCHVLPRESVIWLPGFPRALLPGSLDRHITPKHGGSNGCPDHIFKQTLHLIFRKKIRSPLSYCSVHTCKILHLYSTLCNCVLQPMETYKESAEWWFDKCCLIYSDNEYKTILHDMHHWSNVFHNRKIYPISSFKC